PRPRRPAQSCGCMFVDTTWSIRASGGAPRSTAARNSATAAGGPPIFAETPPGALPPQTHQPSRPARPQKKRPQPPPPAGRTPPPWPTPVPRTDSGPRAVWLSTVPVWRARALSSQTMTTRAAIGYERRERGGLRVLAWPAFDRYPVDALVTPRHGGVSAGD